MENKIKTSMNKISSTINKKNQLLWENEAYAKCYKEKNEKLQLEIKQMEEEILKINNEMTTIKPEIEKLRFAFDAQIKGIQIHRQSLINQKLYKRTQEENLSKLKEKQNLILDEYAANYNKTKEELEDSNSLYKELVLKKIDLKKIEINCLTLQQNIAVIKSKNKQKLEIHQRMFYNDIIHFAQAWLKHQKYSKDLIRLENAKTEERQALTQLLETQESVRKQRTERCHRNDKPLISKFVKLPEKTNENYTQPQSLSKLKIMDLFNNFQKSETSRYALHETTKTQTQQKHAQNSNTKNIDSLNHAQKAASAKHSISSIPMSNDIQKLDYNSDNSKVRILNVQNVKIALDAKKSLPSTSQEKNCQRSQKFDQIVKNISQKFSRQNSKQNLKAFRSFRLSQKSTEPSSQKSIEQCSQKSIVNETSKNLPTGTTQSLDDLKLCSQGSAMDTTDKVESVVEENIIEGEDMEVNYTQQNDLPVSGASQNPQKISLANTAANEKQPLAQVQVPKFLEKFSQGKTMENNETGAISNAPFNIKNLTTQDNTLSKFSSFGNMPKNDNSLFKTQFQFGSIFGQPSEFNQKDIESGDKCNSNILQNMFNMNRDDGFKAPFSPYCFQNDDFQGNQMDFEKDSDMGYDMSFRSPGMSFNMTSTDEENKASGESQTHAPFKFGQSELLNLFG